MSTESTDAEPCSDHTHPGRLALVGVRALAWVISTVFARGFRVVVIAPCVDAHTRSHSASVSWRACRWQWARWSRASTTKGHASTPGSLLAGGSLWHGGSVRSVRQTPHPFSHTLHNQEHHRDMPSNGNYFASSEERAAQVNADKIAQKESERLRRFVEGLESLTSLGISDDRERLSTREEYTQHCADELKRLMRQADVE